VSARAALILCVLLPWLARAAPPEGGSSLPVLERVAVREHSESSLALGLELTFKRLPPDPALARFSVEDARALMEALEAAFQVTRPTSGPPPAKRFLMGAAMTGTLLGPPPDARSSSDLERRVRSDYEELFGASSLPLPSSLENSRWFQALKLSPRYMGEGVREAALAMLSSPAVAYSLGLSMMLYMAAWAAPEPVFSKAFAGAVTLGLLMTYSATELYTVGMACLNLYREAEAARTPEQLEAVAERFGKAMGGVGFRVLVTVAGAKLAKGLPEVPKGGMWGRLSPPRFAFAGGASRGSFIVGAGTRAQVSVANGTVVLMGVSAGSTAAAASAAVASRTTGTCRDEPGKDDARSHHIATNKNDVAEVRGGPWTPLFEQIFRQTGMSLDDPANIVHLVGHLGPHPEEYHKAIYRLLREAVSNCQTQAECKRKLIETLDKIASDICAPDSKFNKLLTKKP
jgi:HNH/ENDO VII superfamily nuclease